MIYKLTSSKTVIAKIFADLDIQEESHRITDMREWIAEAIEKIGSFNQLEKKTKVLVVNNYQAALPSDFYSLNQVAYSFYNGESWIPMRLATGSFDTWGCDCTTIDESDVIATTTLVDLVQNLYRDYVGTPMDYATALSIVNNDTSVRSILTNLLNVGQMQSGEYNTLKTDYEPVYALKPGHVMINTQSGYLNLSYMGVPVDDDGYPMVPELPSFMEAIYWYVTMKLKYPEYLQGRLRQDIYYDIRRSWNFYCKQAYGDAMMPNKDELETIKNQWNRLVPEQSEHDQFYTTSGRAQQINNWN